MGTVGPDDRPGEDEGLEPFGKDGAGHAGNAPADVVEAAAATQDFPYDQEGPSTAQHFVGARHGAELSVSSHARQPITASPTGAVRNLDLWPWQTRRVKGRPNVRFGSLATAERGSGTSPWCHKRKVRLCVCKDLLSPPVMDFGRAHGSVRRRILTLV